MASEQELSQQLEALQQRAEEQHNLAESSRELLYRNLAETYFWWQAAQAEAGYLDRLYAENKIIYRNTANRYNFSPVVRLAFPRIRTDDVTVSNYNKALWAIDNEFISNPRRYANAAKINVMKAYIHKVGGVDGLKELVRSTLDNDDGFAPAQSSKPQRPKAPSESEAELKRAAAKKITSLKMKALKRSKGFATFDAGAVATDNNELVVLLAKRSKATGKISLIASTTDPQIVEDVINECAEVDLSNAPPILRLLAEVLRPHVVIRAVQKLGLRGKFFDTHRVVWGEHGKNTDLRPEAVRLVIRADGTVLVSKTLSDASLTTISTPKSAITLPCDVFLRGPDRAWLEKILLLESQLPLYTCDPADKLADAEAEARAIKQLKLASAEQKHSRTLHFYDVDLIKSEYGYQPIIATDTIGYAWEIKANKKFMDRLFKQSIQGWFDGYGKHFRIDEASRMGFVVHDDNVEIQTHYERKTVPGVNANGFTHYDDDCKTLIGRDAVITRHAATTHTAIVSPLDIIELFTMLAQAQTVGDTIIIRGNEFLMNVSYETASARHEAYIPTLDAKGFRNDELFARYNNA
jgi:hypothetical protein